MKVYVASSWRCRWQPEVVEKLRAVGHEVYDFKNPPNGTGFGWSQTDEGRAETIGSYLRAIQSLRAAEGFASDMHALNEAEATVLVLPCGRSAHLELGYAVGRGQKTIVLLHPDKFEPELMYLMCDHICEDIDEVIRCLEIPPLRKRGATP